MTIQIPSQIVAQLPPHLKPEKVSAYMRLSRGLQDFLGETHLFVQEKKLYCLTSSSTFEPLSQVELSETEKARIVQDGFQQALLLITKDGKEHKLSILLQEQEAQTFLAALSDEAPSQPVALSLPTDPISPPNSINTQATKPEENNDEDDDEDNEDDDGDNSDEENSDNDNDDEDVDHAAQEDVSRAKATERLKNKDYRGAISDTKEAMELAEDEDDKKDYRDAIRCIELLAAGDPVLAYFENNDSSYLYELSDALDTVIGEALEAKGESLLAISAFESVNEDSFLPKISQLRSALGLTEDEEQVKRAERFIEWYQKKVEQDSQDAASWANLASFQNDAMKFDEALYSAQKSIELAPKEVDGYLAASEAIREKGDSSAALVYLQKAAQEEPTAAEVYSAMAELQEYDLDDIEGAIQSYKKAIEYSKYSAEEEEDSLYKIYEKSGRFEELKSFLRERIEKNRSTERKETFQRLLDLLPNSGRSPQRPAPNARPYPIQAVSPNDNLPQRTSNPLGQIFFWGAFIYILIRYVL